MGKIFNQIKTLLCKNKKITIISLVLLVIVIISGIVSLALNLIFYYFYGLNGLGISFILTNMFGMLFTYFVIKWKYNFTFPNKFYPKLLSTYGLVVISFLTVFIDHSTYRYT